MTENDGGPAIDRDGASVPREEERGEKSRKPPPDEPGRGGSSSGDAPAAIDLDTARDRAS